MTSREEEEEEEICNGRLFQTNNGENLMSQLKKTLQTLTKKKNTKNTTVQTQNLMRSIFNATRAQSPNPQMRMMIGEIGMMVNYMEEDVEVWRWVAGEVLWSLSNQKSAAQWQQKISQLLRPETKIWPVFVALAGLFLYGGLKYLSKWYKTGESVAHVKWPEFVFVEYR